MRIVKQHFHRYVYFFLAVLRCLFKFLLAADLNGDMYAFVALRRLVAVRFTLSTAFIESMKFLSSFWACLGVSFFKPSFHNLMVSGVAKSLQLSSEHLLRCRSNIPASVIYEIPVESIISIFSF